MNIDCVPTATPRHILTKAPYEYLLFTYNTYIENLYECREDEMRSTRYKF